jgi:hypothetical protein
MSNPLSELLTEHPELAGKTLAELRAWAQAEEAEACAEAGMLAREMEEGDAAFKALEPYLSGGITTGAALGIMRKVEGADSPKVRAVELFAAHHPFLRAEVSAL